MYPPCYYQSANDLMVTHAFAQMMYMIYYTHPTSVGFEHSVCYELLLTSLCIQQIDKANLQERKQILKGTKKETAKTIPLSLKYNRTLPKIKEIVMKHWHLLHINPNLAEIFQNLSVLAFHRNKNLRNIIVTKLIENGKVKRKFTNKMQGKCAPSSGNNITLCRKQVTNITTFRSNQTNRIFQTYHNLNIENKYVIYLLEYTKCKIQYVRKAETEFNFRLNNHRKDL